MSIKTLTVNIMQWVDRVYGNTYFAAHIIVDGETKHVLPFQYGHGSIPQQTVAETLWPGCNRPLHAMVRENGIEYSESVSQGTKRSVRAFGRVVL